MLHLGNWRIRNEATTLTWSVDMKLRYAAVIARVG
jgi:hypothetical protein